MKQQSPKAYIVKDIHTLDTLIGKDGDDLAELVRPWYPEAPQEVLDVIDRLGALGAGGGIEQYDLDYLGLEISTTTHLDSLAHTTDINKLTNYAIARAAFDDDLVSNYNPFEDAADVNGNWEAATGFWLTHPTNPDLRLAFGLDYDEGAEDYTVVGWTYTVYVPEGDSWEEITTDGCALDPEETITDLLDNIGYTLSTWAAK